MEISVSRSRTVNLGNYESEKIQVGITTGVAGPDDLDGVYSFCLDWCDDKVKEEIRKITGEDDGEWK